MRARIVIFVVAALLAAALCSCQASCDQGALSHSLGCEKGSPAG